MGDNTVGVDEWVALLDTVGRVYDKRLEVVDKDMLMAVKVP
jgi:hypothetical protein